MPHNGVKNNVTLKRPDFILQLGRTWNLRLLTSDSSNEIESFIELFNDFFQLCEGENGSGSGILNACPPSKDIHKDKFVLGLHAYPKSACDVFGFA